MKNNVYEILSQKLKNKKLFLFDMDGTIYEEDRLFNGTLELMNKIINIGGKYVFITNNSSKSVNEYIKKVLGLGIHALLSKIAQISKCPPVIARLC